MPAHLPYPRLLLCLLLTLAAIGCHRTPAPSDPRQELVGAPPAPTARPAAPLPTQPGRLWYRILPQRDTLDISVRLLRPPERVSFFLPGLWAGEADWASQIRIKGATSEKGNRPFTLQRPIGRLDIDAGEQAEFIELAYEVALSERRDDSLRFAPQHLSPSPSFFAYAPPLFILPSEQLATRMSQIPVEIRTPHGWSLVSTWERAHLATSRQADAIDVHGFIVPDARTLRDAFLIISPSLSLDTIDTVRVAYEPTFEGEHAPFSAFIAQVVLGYEARFGKTTPQTTALVRAPLPSGSAPYRWGTGRRGGFVLELDPRAALDHEAKLLIAHEAFHLWNGHALVPSTESEFQTRWFKEGLTQYVALKILHELGHVSERAMLDEIALAATRYEAAHASGTLPRDKNEHAAYPYDKGLLLAMELDQLLLQSSHGTLDLRHWLAALLDQARLDPNWHYDQESLMTSLSPFVSPDHPGFERWREHVTEARRISPTPFFEPLGLHWLPPEPPRPAKLVPLNREDTPWRTMLDTRWSPSSPP